MKRMTKILVITMALAAVLVLSIAGTALAAGGNSGNGNRGEECPYGDNVSGECEPKAYSCNYSYEYESPGPHGPKYAEKNGVQTASGEGAQHQFRDGRTTE
jgi:hypothetical protein